MNDIILKRKELAKAKEEKRRIERKLKRVFLKKGNWMYKKRKNKQ